MRNIEIKKLAKNIRLDLLKMIFNSQSSHIGSSLSIVDLLAVLYGKKIIKFDPDNPSLLSRDRFILSKGHAAAALYSALANVGYFSRRKLLEYGNDNSKFMAHVSHQVPGVEFSTGSLGHGLPIGCGLAFAKKRKKFSNYVFVINSDGEMSEGSNWEAILFASHHKLDNLILIIDYNKLQSFGTIENTLGLEPLKDKFLSFGWNIVEIDGHNHKNIEQALLDGKASKGKPSCIIANTVKGKGVSFMENKVEWHYKSPNKKEYNQAVKELNLLEILDACKGKITIIESETKRSYKKITID